MPLSREVLRLESRWQAGTGWPKRLQWVEIRGLRGWEGQRFDLKFPIMAIVGENGSGKSTVIQCAASIYQAPSEKKPRFASDFFLDTAWESIKNASIAYSVREGDENYTASIRRPGPRWRGNSKRRTRNVEYIDLSRVQPVSSRVGYLRLAKGNLKEVSSDTFEESRLRRFNQIMGRDYDVARLSLTDADEHREVVVLSHQGNTYSGFHQGAGETTMVELLRRDLPRYSLVLIDEIETSLHPRAQRRLIRDLADRCRERELQVVLTTHSPSILDELPMVARAQILQSSAGRHIVYGVSPEFAMTQMDDVPQYECDIYVEDARAAILLREILAAREPTVVKRCRLIPFGAATVGKALGQMVAGERFPRPSLVYLDGDQGTAEGCENLPSEDAPERLVFSALRERNWLSVDKRVGRPFSDVFDCCTQAMSFTNHHEWVRHAATALVLGGDALWQAMCAEWSTECLDDQDAKSVIGPVLDAVPGKPTPGIASSNEHPPPL